MALKAETRRATQKYGPRVNKLARKRYGISGQTLLRKLVQGESGGRRNAVSSAGARGEAQFMPGTRQAALKHGVDPWRSSDEAVHAAVMHLRGKLTGSKGLEGYNPGGGRKYVDYILSQKVGNDSKRARGSSTSTKKDSSGVSVRESSKTTSTFDKAGYEKALRGQTLARILSKRRSDSALLRTGALSAAPVDKAAFEGSKTTKSRKVSGTQGEGSEGGRSPGKRPGKRVLSGKVIGTPHSGTHTVGNWQSDNAVDLRLKPGSPVRATTDGVVVKVGGNAKDKGRFGGVAITIKGKHGGTFYTHLRSSRVRPGQRVRRGDILGGSGVANGVPHLHYGQERGNPQKRVKR